MTQEVLDKVRDIIVDIIEIDREKIVPEASLSGDLRADSLASVEIVMAIEDEFRIELDEEVARRLSTIGSLVDAIEANCSARATHRSPA